MLPPQLVVAPHPLAVLLHVRQVGRPDQLHDVLEPRARLADGAGRAGPAVGAAGHPGPVAGRRAVLEVVGGGDGTAALPRRHQLVHRLPLQDLQGDAGQGLSEAVLSGAAGVHAFVLAEDAAEQEALLRGHDAVVQLHLEEAGTESE